MVLSMACAHKREKERKKERSKERQREKTEFSS